MKKTLFSIVTFVLLIGHLGTAYAALSCPQVNAPDRTGTVNTILADLYTGKCTKFKNNTFHPRSYTHGPTYGLSLDNTNRTDVYIQFWSLDKGRVIRNILLNNATCRGAGCARSYGYSHLRCNAPSGAGDCNIRASYTQLYEDGPNGYNGGRLEFYPDTYYSFTIANNTNFIPAITFRGGQFTSAGLRKNKGVQVYSRWKNQANKADFDRKNAEAARLRAIYTKEHNRRLALARPIESKIRSLKNGNSDGRNNIRIGTLKHRLTTIVKYAEKKISEAEFNRITRAQIDFFERSDR